jgi:predicted dehydrogenase
MVALAFAGAGFVTAIHGLAGDALPDMRVVHVASRTKRSAQRRAAQTGGIACSYEELPGGADVVLVATPPALHRREAERAVDGSAVALVEAPLATTLEDADLLVALGARDGRVGYAENLVHSPTVVEAVRACRRLGSLTHLEVRPGAAARCSTSAYTRSRSPCWRRRRRAPRASARSCSRARGWTSTTTPR